MKWVVYHKCVQCGTVLTDGERFYRDGCCPHCGFVSNGTVCRTYKFSERQQGSNTMKWILTVVVFFALCIGVGYWIYRANLPAKPQPRPQPKLTAPAGVGVGPPQ